MAERLPLCLSLCTLASTSLALADWPRVAVLLVPGGRYPSGYSPRLATHWEVLSRSDDHAEALREALRTSEGAS